MGDLREGLEIGHVELRVADGLRINRASLSVIAFLNSPGFARVDEFYRTTQLGKV